MTQETRTSLENLAALLREEQRGLLIGAARLGTLPSNGTLERIAQLELNIAAIENTLNDAPAVS